LPDTTTSTTATGTASVETPSTWTPDRIFSSSASVSQRELPVWITMDRLRTENYNDHTRSHSQFTTEFLAAALAETSWVRSAEASPSPVPLHVEEAVGHGLTSCPECNNSGRVWLPHKGSDSGIDLCFPQSCPCSATKAFWFHWTRFEARSSRFAKVNLKYLEPSGEQSSLPLERQVEIIALLKAQPTDSYFLFGPPNTGKTPFLTALHRVALRRWSSLQWRKGAACNAVWRMRTADLLDEHVAWERRDKTDENSTVPLPSVTVKKL
jgi:hypothetical protein